jgi:hypothetical protein
MLSICTYEKFSCNKSLTNLAIFLKYCCPEKPYKKNCGNNFGIEKSENL